MNLELSQKAYQVREMILRSAELGETEHVTSPFSCAEILTTLYLGNVLRFDCNNLKWSDRDRFVLSKGHAAVGLFCTLAAAGVISTEIALKVDSRLKLYDEVADFICGSLGQGLGLGCGIAMAARMDRKNHLTFVLSGDGELNEGSMWEAALFAGHHKLNNLVWIIDRNRMQCADFTENSLALEPLKDKIEAFGFRTAVCDGHDCGAILSALCDVRSRPSAKPLCLIAETVKGKGLPHVENDLLTHFYMPKPDEVQSLIGKHITPFTGTEGAV